jgi:hypothetical protein
MGRVQCLALVVGGGCNAYLACGSCCRRVLLPLTPRAGCQLSEVSVERGVS